MTTAARAGAPPVVEFDGRTGEREIVSSELAWSHENSRSRSLATMDGIERDLFVQGDAERKRQIIVRYLDASAGETGSVGLEEYIRSGAPGMKVSAKIPGTGPTFSSMFYRIRLKNTGAEPEMILRLLGYFNDVRVVVDRAGTWTRMQAGRIYPIRALPIDDAFRGVAIPLEIPPGETTEVWIKSTNFGSPQSIKASVMTPRAYEKSTQLSYALHAIYFGTMVSLLIYHIGIFLISMERMYLFYSFFLGGSILLSINMRGLGSLVFTDTYYSLHNVWTFTSAVGVNILSYLLFARDFLQLPSRWPWWNRILLGTLVFNLAILLISSIFLPFDLCLRICMVVGGTGLLIPFFASVQGIFRGQKEGLFFALSFSMIIFALIPTILANQGILEGSYITRNGLYIGSFAEALLLSIAMGDKIRTLNLSLNTANSRLREYIGQVEELVEMKTRNIRSILKNIRAGVFTVNQDFKVDDEYSACLPDLLGTRRIAGREDPVQLIFNDSGLTMEEKARVETAMLNALGGPEINWLLNEHIFPREFIVDREDGQKIYEAAFDPIYNGETVDRVLVTIRDVSKLRSLEAESRRKTAELELLRQVAEVEPGRFEELLEEADRWVEENRRLISAPAADRAAAISEMFINMHTLKGNARLVGLEHVSRLVHEVESFYDSVREDLTSWNEARMLADLDKVATMLGQCQDIFYLKLGRSPGTGLRLDGEKIAALAGGMDGDAWQQILQHKRFGSVARDIHDYCFADCLDFCLQLLESLGPLARSLEKPVPAVRVEGEHIGVSMEGRKILRDVLTHLMRNAVDHGIESAGARQDAGKPARGELHLYTSLEGPWLKIRFGDDGRGLHLPAIRQVAVQRDLMADSDQVADQAVMEMIFKPGFSTRQVATDLSGRGVGMDAVRQHLSAAGGSITIRPRGDAGDGYQPFEFELKLPLKFCSPVQGLSRRVA